ncbi:Fructose import permease protein FrcC [subsurface metagenome]
MAEVTERRKRGTARDIARRVFRHENATLGIMLAAIIGALALATGGKSIRISNMKMVVVEGATMGIGAIGQMFVLLTGGIDLSVAGMAFGTSALGSAMMTTQLWQNILVKNSILGYTEAASIWVGVPAMLAMGVGLGLISGLFVSRIGIPPFIATLGMWQIAHGIGFLITGGFTIVRMVDPLRFFGQRFIYGFPVAGIIWIVVGAVVYFVLHHLNYGRAVYASGGNPIMAWLSGINVKATQLSVYMISGFMAALGGLIRTGRVMSVSYSSFDFLELQTIASAVIGGVSLFGGKGTVIGVVLGALVISVVLNGMTILRADPFLESLILGVIVIAAVAVDYWRGR